MNLEKAKALFFAQYLFQRVCIHSEGRYPNVFDHGSLYGRSLKKAVLLLRSVSQLTDKEYIKLASIVIENPFNRYRNVQVTRDFKITGFPYVAVHHKNVRHRFNIDCTHFNFSVYDMEEDVTAQVDMKPYACIDYLRSVGILLPFTYLNEENKPITLQPDEIIKLVWAKYLE